MHRDPLEDFDHALIAVGDPHGALFADGLDRGAVRLSREIR